MMKTEKEIQEYLGLEQCFIESEPEEYERILREARYVEESYLIPIRVGMYQYCLKSDFGVYLKGSVVLELSRVVVFEEEANRR